MNMIKQLFFLTIIMASCGFAKVKKRPLIIDQETESSIYDFEMPLLNGDVINFSAYKGKKILIVNTASECGYTRQYKGLGKSVV